jgi:hypothetical protein
MADASVETGAAWAERPKTAPEAIAIASTYFFMSISFDRRSFPQHAKLYKRENGGNQREWHSVTLSLAAP